jgi:phenylacetate-CoA ligase
VYAFRTGPFAQDGSKLKNEYVWTLDGAEVDSWGLRSGYTPPRDAV